MFDAGKTRVIGLPYGEKNCDDMLSRFHLIPERNGQTDGRTDAQTDRFAISISRVSMLTRDKNQPNHTKINTSNTEETHHFYRRIMTASADRYFLIFALYKYSYLITCVK